MIAKNCWLASIVAGSLLSSPGTSIAQMSMYSPRPLSGGGSSYSSTEMGSIYRQSIGNEFSASSILRNDLNRSRARVPYVGQSSTSSSGFDVGLPSGPATKPFAGVRAAPSVSPWMNMFRDDLSGESDLNYQTLVRPQLEQQRFNDQVQRQNMELAGRVQAISAQNAYNPGGSEMMYPTGHPTVFMNYGHYYPSANRRRR